MFALVGVVFTYGDLHWIIYFDASLLDVLKSWETSYWYCLLTSKRARRWEREKRGWLFFSLPLQLVSISLSCTIVRPSLICTHYLYLITTSS